MVDEGNMPKELSPKEHLNRHILLSKILDELCADYISSIKDTLLSEISVLNLIIWSANEIARLKAELRNEGGEKPK